jgi:tetratricopeptide (TPR) repeat protein
MKKNKSLFLFLAFLLSFLYNSQAQQQKDSLNYYYYFLQNAKKSSDLIKAYTFYNTHKELSLIKNDTINAIQDLRFISFIQYELGLLNESEVSAVNALQLANNLKTNKTVISAKVGIYNRLGILSRELKNYDRAIEYYDKVLEVEEDLSKITAVLNNKAITYKHQMEYTQALKELLKVYKNSISLKDTVQIARSLDNMGLVKSKLNIPQGLQDMLLALDMRLKRKSNSGLYVSYIHLAEHYYDRNNIYKTRYYAEKAYDAASKMNNIGDKITALSFLIDIGNNSIALEFKRLTDSVAMLQLLNKKKFVSIKYDYKNEKRKAEETKIELYKSQLVEEEERQSKLLFQLISSFGLVIVVLLYILIKTRHKKEKAEQVYFTETRISKKVHDEVANDIYQIMTQLQENNSNDDEVIDAIESIYFKTRDISKENSPIDVHKNFGEVIEDLALSYDNSKTNIIINDLKTVDWRKISDEKKITIYRILQELMTNMKKHSKASHVVITFIQKPKIIFINYLDNGIGGELKKGSGLQNTESRINSIDGKITFESVKDKGFKAKLVI